MTTFLRVSAIVVVAIALLSKQVIVPFLFRMMKSAPPDDAIGEIPLLKPEELRSHYRDRSILVVGGTRGVGLGTALILAEAGAAEITIVGRSENSGKAALDRLRKVAFDGEGQKFRFVRGDLGSVRSANDLVRSLSEDSDQRFDDLVVSAAVFPDFDKPLLQEDGLDTAFTIAVVGRYIVYKNMDKFMRLEGGAGLPRVVNVLAAGLPPIQSLNRDFVTGQSTVTNLFQSLAFWGLCNDLMLIGMQQEDGVDAGLAKRVTMVSTHPGFLKTDLHRGQGLWFDVLEWICCLFMGSTIEEAGARHASVMASDRLREGSLSYVNEHMQGRARSDGLQKEVDDHLAWFWSFLQDTVKSTSMGSEPDKKDEAVIEEKSDQTTVTEVESDDTTDKVAQSSPSVDDTSNTTQTAEGDDTVAAESDDSADDEAARTTASKAGEEDDSSAFGAANDAEVDDDSLAKSKKNGKAEDPPGSTIYTEPNDDESSGGTHETDDAEEIARSAQEVSDDATKQAGEDP